MSDFDAIVVGGGTAGLTAAYLMAKGGAEVLLVERGATCGSKNMTGGRLYSHSLEKVIPGFAEKAPVQRKITRERISLMTGESAVTVDYASPGLGESGRDSYSVLRATFDPWLAEQAEDAGASIITGIRVDDLLVDDGAVRGISAGGDDITADVTLLADGANSLLAQKLGMRSRLKPQHMAVGVKETIALDPHVIEDRFQCRPGEGAAWLFAGHPSGGKVGGGFIYTNESSISLGVVATLSELVTGDQPLPDLIEGFKQHSAVEPLVRGGELIEYSAHLVPEGGMDMVPELHREGVLVLGDAAGFCLNLGYMVRGMDLAIGSAQCAAETVLEAREAGDFSAISLARYRAKLDASFVMQEMRHYRKFPHFLEGTPRIFSGYPEMASQFFQELMVVDGAPPKPFLKKVWGTVKDVGIMNLVRDGVRGVRAL